MKRAHVLIVALTALMFTIVPGFTAMAQDSNTEPPTPLRMYDISMDINGQRYACKVMVNEAATLGGSALLFLHGAGECGTEGVRQLHVGLPRYAMQSPEDWPFVIIAPQKPTVNSEWEDHSEAVMALLDRAAELELFDPDRLAITGLSQGGHGTITIAGLHPDRFKAASPVCAYVRPVFNKDRERIARTEASKTDPEVIQAAERLAQIPIWLHHGDADSVVPVQESRAIQQALRSLGAEVRYSEYHNVDHNSWDNAYQDSNLSDWFKELLSE
ncbi:MAG: prolyl oligopeptidase family serine peptidase [Phycisphaerales bacterium]|nr:prolyl oligopeptidase family serine peptidase [Phycisphaerales bacterium]